jgi:hypothetical protein
MCTPGASDRVVLGPDWSGFGMFYGVPSDSSMSVKPLPGPFSPEPRHSRSGTHDGLDIA